MYLLQFYHGDMTLAEETSLLSLITIHVHPSNSSIATNKYIKWSVCWKVEQAFVQFKTVHERTVFELIPPCNGNENTKLGARSPLLCNSLLDWFQLWVSRYECVDQPLSLVTGTLSSNVAGLVAQGKVCLSPSVSKFTLGRERVVIQLSRPDYIVHFSTN